MPKKTISLALTAEQVELLESSFGAPGPSKSLSDDQLQAITRLGIESWIGAISGPKRYRSLGELYLDWLQQLYSQVLVDEEPNERRIFSQLHFPYGQARYLARVLREHHSGAWRRKALSSLRDSLVTRLNEAKQWVRDGRGEERMVFTLTKGSRVELDFILDALSEAGVPGTSPIRVEGAIGSRVSLAIVASNIEPILGEAKRLLGG